MENLSEQVTQYALAQLPLLAAFLLRIVLCFAVWMIGRKVIAWAVRVIRQAMERAEVQTGAVTFTTSFIKILLYAVLVIGIAMQFGLTESSVAALLASGGVAIGLALQGGLSNFAGGFLILLFQPFRIGDYIIAQGTEGTVRKIEILYTTLETVDSRQVIVPNGVLANDVIVNVTAAKKRRLEIKVGIAYESSIQRAREVLEQLLEEEDRILKDEEKQIFVAELAASSVVIGIRCWVNTEDYFPVFWHMNERIKETFEKEEIRIPYPQMEVQLRDR